MGVETMGEEESSEVPDFCHFSFDLVRTLAAGGEQRVHSLAAENWEEIPDDAINRRGLRKGEVIKVEYDEERHWPVRIIHDHSVPISEDFFFGEYRYLQFREVPFGRLEGFIWKILNGF